MINKKKYIISILGVLDKIKISIFSFQNSFLEIDSLLILNNQASRDLISAIDTLLKKYELSLHELSFILVDSGPGAFTTIRTIAATVNGLAFGNNLKLLPFNSLEQLILASNKNKNESDFIVGCLNAYGRQVYTSIYCCKQQVFIETDLCLPISQFIQKVSHLYENKMKIKLVGNGINIYEKELLELNHNFVIFENIIEINMLSFLNELNQTNPLFRSEVFPNYIKPGFN